MRESVAQRDARWGRFDEFAGARSFAHAGLRGHGRSSFYTLARSHAHGSLSVALVQPNSGNSRGISREGLFLGSLRVRVFLLEALDAPRRVHQLLLAGKKRMAIRADFHVHPLALDGRARLEGVPAGAMHEDFVVVGVNAGFHEDSDRSRPVCAAPPTKPGTHSRVARPRRKLQSYVNREQTTNPAPEAPKRNPATTFQVRMSFGSNTVRPLRSV